MLDYQKGGLRMKAILASFGSRTHSAELETLQTKLSLRSPIETESVHLSHITGRTTLEAAITDDSIIMPLLIQKGYEYRRILSLGLPTGEPLLSSSDDIMRIAGILRKELERKAGRTYIFAAHGNKDERIAQYDELNETLPDDIRIITMQGPCRFPAENIMAADEIILMPFLLTIGHHALIDMQEKVLPKLRRLCKQVSYVNESILSLSTGFYEIFEDHFCRLLEELNLLPSIGREEDMLLQIEDSQSSLS